MESPDKSKSRRRGRGRGVLEERWVWAGAAASLLALAAVARLDLALPEPLHRGAPPDRFIADIAREHLVNLTVIGPRVAGSYENEVAAVRVLLAAVRDIARRAAPHHNIDIDLHTASGAFSIQFFDGLNNVYRGVQSVVVRVRGASGGGAGLGPRSALLLNCHFDTVPDSPGASDDAAGCAVLLETLRALVASPRGLEHDAVFLLNGAEENIMQASHAFITQHKWAKNIRAFINLEACGAGGREVLFQAGPHDPWIMEVYAGAVPHPFASSLAQELFESGLIPADTDFRIFRDFGKLSGVDLAWSANGYVYHTALDTADKVSAACLQRTGDNVLALTRGLLSSGSLQQEVDRASRQPVFFDVVGLVVVCARAGAAASLALLTVGVVLLRIHRNATDAKKHLYISRGWWWRQVARRVAAAAGALLAGGGAAVGVALLLTAGGRPLSYYCHTLLLAPLFALPGVCGAWCVVRVLVARGGGGGGGGHWSGAVVVGWWEARAWADAVAVLWAVALALCAARGLRSGFLPLLWALLPSLADLAASLTVAGGGVHVHGGARAWWWALGAALPLVQTWYLAVGWLRTFVPLLGRAGTRAPPDLAAALVVAALVLAATSWLLPLVAAAASLRRTLYAGLAVSVATLLVVQCTSLVPPYSAARPQRLMVFHVRRTLHPRSDVTTPPPPPPPEHFFWLPELEPNIPHSLDMYVAGMRDAVRSTGEECVRYPYCGAAYYLPVLSLVPHAHALTAPRPPRTTLAATLALAPAPTLGTERLLTVDLTGPSHVVVVVAVAEGAALSWVDVLGGAPLEGPLWEGRRTYFFTLHDARGQADKTWHIEMRIQHSFSSEPAQWAWVSVAGHSLSGDHQLSPDHAALKRELPLWAHATGWGVDLHLFDI